MTMCLVCLGIGDVYVGGRKVVFLCLGSYCYQQSQYQSKRKRRREEVPHFPKMTAVVEAIVKETLRRYL